MNREIIFRAKQPHNGEWMEGYFSKDYAGVAYITTLDGVSTGVVDESTLSQFTGLTDSKGNKVFEGDFLHGVGYLCKVVFERGCFRTIYEHPEDGEVLILGEDIDPTDYTVIGTIHDTHLTKQS